MKKILILALVSLTLACSKDKDDKPENIDQWRMIYFQAGATNDTFDDDDIKWTFNFDTSILTVENNVSGMYSALVPSGTYSFTFENNIIAIDYSALFYEAAYDLSENDTKLTLFFDLIPEAIDDEQTYGFEKL
jgi:hypothetical protein